MRALVVITFSLFFSNLAAATPNHGLQMASGQTVRKARTFTVQQKQIAGRSGWLSLTDRSLGTPIRMWGSSPRIPNVVADEATAARHATEFVHRHLSQLAPGAKPSDLVLASNRRTGKIRAVGFLQYKNGLPVLGGQISVRYQADRLAMIASEAYPYVPDIAPQSVWLSKRSAANAVSKMHQAQSAMVRMRAELAILPVVLSNGQLTYYPVEIADAETNAPFDVMTAYFDTRSGQLVATASKISYSASPVSFRVPARYPGDGYQSFPASYVALSVDGEDTIADLDGTIEYSVAAGTATLSGVAGTLVEVEVINGTPLSQMQAISDGQEATFTAEGSEFDDAQLSVFVHANIAKEYARLITPDLPLLDEKLIARVNRDGQCNAFFDGTTINFLKSGETCDNTALMADVVYHEFGHALHRASVIEGVGRFDGSFSEGVSDFFAALITEDAAVGRGFRYNSLPIRDLNPASQDVTWPDDISGVHRTGQIYGRSMWELWQTLRTDLGNEAADEIVRGYVRAALERSSDIPTAYLETLLEDDDDGDLSNGTPNLCAISQAFGKRGLRIATLDAPLMGSVPPSESGFQVEASISGFEALCANETILDVELAWYRRGSSDINFVSMKEESGTYSGKIPAQPKGTVVRYRLRVLYDDGSRIVFPQNPADPWVEFHIGETIPLYCTSFETDPLSEGWSTSGNGEWEWGKQSADDRTDDPSAAFDGEKYFGNDLGLDGGDTLYPADTKTVLTMPTIETGDYSDVRLQYWRWLNVEDGFFDQARILVNNRIAWENRDSDMGSSSAVHHRDMQWTFHDVPLSRVARQGPMTVTFELETDGGLELGGWNLDSLCIVVDPSSVCGDGIVSHAEACDGGDNNSNSPDRCRTFCQRPECGDGIIDSGEGCDDGNDVDDDGCTNQCINPDDFGTDLGCSGGGPAPFVALLFAIGVLVRRRA